MKLFLLAISLLSSTVYAQDPIIEVTCEYRHYFADENDQIKDLSPVYKITKRTFRDDGLELITLLWADIGPVNFFTSVSFSGVGGGEANPVGRIRAEFTNSVDQTGMNFGAAFPYRDSERSVTKFLYKTNKFTHNNLSVNRIDLSCSGHVVEEFIK